ncbi:MAG: hypothetical protein IPG38_02580 [Chitinophagaceae bacterium]|nr:hypothetical protein [Chitinophagaceae bacterium]
MKKFWIKKGLMILVFGSIAILVFGFVVMSLWNAILPAVLGVKAISFIQALGILLLSKILFGGFRGGCGGRQRSGQVDGHETKICRYDTRRKGKIQSRMEKQVWRKMDNEPGKTRFFINCS